MAGKQIKAGRSTAIDELLQSLNRDGEQICVVIDGEPIVLEIRRVRETSHLSMEEKMKLVQGAFAAPDGSLDTDATEAELERFKSPLDFE